MQNLKNYTIIIVLNMQVYALKLLELDVTTSLKFKLVSTVSGLNFQVDFVEGQIGNYMNYVGIWNRNRHDDAV